MDIRNSFVGLTLARDECLLCQKNKTNKSGSGYESLATCVTAASATCLLDYGNNNIDEYASLQLVGLSVNEIVAKEFKYHRSCYKNLQRSKTQNHENQDETMNLREKCFEDLKSVIRDQIVEDGDNITLSELSGMYAELQEKLGLEIVGTQNRNLKERLKKAFGNQLSFHQKSIGLPETIYNTEKFNKVRLYDPIEIVKEAGRIVRKELSNCPDIYTEWPPNEKELLKNRFETPSYTEALLRAILTSNASKTERSSRLVDSIAQDLLYNSSNGRKRVPKHVQLGLSVKRKTGSVNVIRWLNRFGHCISYDEINSTETKLAEEQAHSKTARAYVPNNIRPGSLVTFVYDNCDHNAESIYNVTVHGTNGIVIQMKNNNHVSNEQNIPPPRSATNIQSIKRRSFKPVLQEVQPFIKSKERPNPKPIQNIEKEVNQLDGWISKYEDLCWSILRYKNNQNQVIPAWKGFFHEVSPTVDDHYIVGYLPMIRGSPTKMETVKDVLVQCKEKATQLGLSETDLVLDHAIYCKAVEIITDDRHTDLRDFINLRMGGFHATCIFLGVIGKRFADAGLKDLIIETGLIGEDSAEQLLKGKHYNNAMRIHHYVAEAITRLKLDAFQDWLRSNGKYHVYESAVHTDEINVLNATRNTANMRSCMECFQELFGLHEEFEETLSDHERFPMAVFWNSYLDMVQTLRDFSKSIKLGDWDLHIYSSEKMLHWYHAYDHFNYARNFSFYWASQQSLSVTHPAIYDWFKDGGFSTRRSQGKFNKVSPDQVIEQTVNKDQKGPGKIHFTIIITILGSGIVS